MIATSPRTRKNGKPLAARVARRPGLERRFEHGHRSADIGVVIAGNEAHVVGIAERLHPEGGEAELGGHADIDQIAGHRDMVRALCAQILDEAGEDAHVVQPLAAALPVDVAHEALEAKIGEARQWRGRKMRIGDMRDREAHAPP